MLVWRVLALAQSESPNPAYRAIELSQHNPGQSGILAEAQQDQPSASPSAAEKPPFSPDDYATECQKRQRTAEADLCQQWRMANAAEKQVEIVKWQYDIQKLEVFLLAGTFGFSLYALWLTINTTRAELRAYVFVERLVWDTEHGMGVANQISLLRVKNGGQTPAHDVTVSVSLAVGPRAWRAMKNGPQSARTQQTSFHLPPGEHSELNVSMRELAAQFPLFTSRTHDYFVWGVVTYKDVFGRRWETGYRMFLSNDGITSFASCEHGNYAT